MTYDLPFPVSLNAMYANNKRTGRGRYPTAEYQAWKLEAGLMLRRQKPCAFQGRAIVVIDLDETRKGDAANYEKGVTDLLVAHGILADDSKKYVKRISQGWEPITGCRVTIHDAETHRYVVQPVAVEAAA